VQHQLRCYFSVMFLVFLSACTPATMSKLLAQGQKPLSEKQLLELVTNHSLHLEAIDLNANIKYLPNGHLVATSLQGEKEKGKWNITPTPDSKLCMKFDRWYYSDLKCYTLFSEGDKYVFFTSNGARYYTGTASANTMGKQQSQVAEIESPTASQNDYSTTPLSRAEKEHTLISLARNCPDCNFAGVDLRNAQLTTANLAGANLSKADLSDANLRRANLAGADLSGANLTRTNLAGADLSNCNLKGADLTGSNLIRATVTGANLEGAILLDAHLDSIQGLKK